MTSVAAESVRRVRRPDRTQSPSTEHTRSRSEDKSVLERAAIGLVHPPPPRQAESARARVQGSEAPAPASPLPTMLGLEAPACLFRSMMSFRGPSSMLNESRSRTNVLAVSEVTWRRLFARGRDAPLRVGLVTALANPFLMARLTTPSVGEEADNSEPDRPDRPPGGPKHRSSSSPQQSARVTGNGAGDSEPDALEGGAA